MPAGYVDSNKNEFLLPSTIDPHSVEFVFAPPKSVEKRFEGAAVDVTGVGSCMIHAAIEAACRAGVVKSQSVAHVRTDTIRAAMVDIIHGIR